VNCAVAEVPHLLANFCVLGDNGKRQLAANGHLKAKHDIVGQQPGTTVARTTVAATRLVVE